MKLKYDLKIGTITYQSNMEVKLATLDEVRAIFPRIKIKSDSYQVGVWIPGIDHPTIIPKKFLVA